MEKLPNVHALFRNFAFEYKVHKYGIITPQTSFRTKTSARYRKIEVKQGTWNINMVEHQEKIPNEECNIRHDSTKHWNQHAHQGKHERQKKNFNNK